MRSPTIALPSKCLRCEAELISPIVCDGCRSLFPLSASADYFDLLGTPKRYAVDATKLTAAFRALARSVHPDRFTREPDEVRALATRLSAELNQAFSVLKDPVRRADYMLERAGGPSAAQMRDVPGNLLAEVMMLREEIDEARSAGNVAALDRHREAIQSRRDEALQKIASGADRLTILGDDERRELRRLLNSVKYFDNLLAELTVDPLAVAGRNTDG